MLTFTHTLIFVIILASFSEIQAAEGPRPNVIFVLTDDQGAMDVGCYGAKDIETPAMDALAAQGVRFTQFYAAAPICSPSRAALLTGRYPLRAGLTGNASSEKGGHGLPTGQVTLAEMFKAAGYSTAHIGKWHLGFTPEEMPTRQGFDYSFGHMGGCIDNLSHYFYWNGPNRHDLYRNGEEVFYPGRFFADLMVEEAGHFMEKNRQKPFFIYFALNMPHYPYQGDAKWLERYKDLPYPRNLYAAFLSSCDERIGTLLKKLDDLDLRKQTIIVFQSDNGHSTEERAHSGGGSAGPYRGAKFSMFEGGIRLPSMLSWTGHLPEGAVRSQMVHACDWMPTLAELCDVKLLNPDIDGKSIASVVRSADAVSPHQVLYWGGGRHSQWAVREGDWKLIGNVLSAKGDPVSGEDKKLFLSNPETDPSEKTNLAKKYPDVVQRLLRLRQEWLEQNAKMETQETPAQDKNGNEK